MEEKIPLKDIEIERVQGVGHIKRNKKRKQLLNQQVSNINNKSFLQTGK